MTQYACAYLTDAGDLYTELPKNKKELEKWLAEMEDLNYKAVVFRIDAHPNHPATIDWDDYT